MKFVLVLAFIAYGHTYHKEQPYESMNDCVKFKKLVENEFKSSTPSHKLLSATCEARSK